MDKKFKWDMFITSLLPLWLSILVVAGFEIGTYMYNSLPTNMKIAVYLMTFFKSNILELVLFLIVLTISLNSIFGICTFLRSKKKSKNKQSGKIKKSKKLRKLSSEFLLAYVLPMIAFDFTDIKDVILFLIYFLILAWLCVRNNNVYTNVLLELKGYKMYECDIECNVLNDTYVYSESLLISKQDLTLQNDNMINYWDFDNYIYIDLNEG